MISILMRMFESRKSLPQRREERLEAENKFGVDFRVKGLFSRSGRGSGKDISPSGIRFATSTPLKKGQRLQLQLELPMDFPGKTQVSASAEVMRVYRPQGAQRYRVACRFLQLKQSPETATLLDEFVWWLDRASLQFLRSV